MEYSYNWNDLSNQSETNLIYIDDILCTGNTLFYNIKDWLTENNKLEGLKNNNKKLIFLYIFIHSKNYHKKMAQFRYKIDQSFDSFTTMIRAIEIDNSSNGKMDLVKPIEEGQSQKVIDYQQEIEEIANNNANEKGYKPYPVDFYRTQNIEKQEEFYTSKEQRIIFENAILEKGIDILNSVNTNVPNIRALGYSLPTYKDFGFGTLAFTWRSIPNNTPLVFWYETNSFIPLFKRKSTW